MAEGTAPLRRPLLPLRPEVRLHPGPADVGGAPTWTLHDPAANRFFRIGWSEAEMLARWNLGDAGRVAEAVAASTPLAITPATVVKMAAFLEGNGLVQATGAAEVRRLAAIADAAEAARSGLGMKILHNYLGLRLPLFRPDRFLDATLPWVTPLYSRTALTIFIAVGLAGLYLTSRQWEMFLSTFQYLHSWQGVLFFLVTLAGTKTIHELAHAYTAKRHGCRIPTMGVAFLVLWPVLYTDTTEAWKLSGRGQRLSIAGAGVAAELGLAALAGFLWSLLPEGPARSAVVLTAATTWITSVAVNLNPFMKFDGYYLFSDFLGVENLQDRAFALARWKMREVLFGWQEPPPEVFAPKPRRILLAYAYGCWIWRAVLYLGIAFLVYHQVFKLAGIVLLAIELGWFLLRPVGREAALWWRERRRMRLNLRTVGTLALVAATLTGLLLPWPAPVHAPAMLRAAVFMRVHAPVPAEIVEAPVHPGRKVEAGELLVVLAAPELDRAEARAKAKIASLHWEMDHAFAEASTLERHPVIQEKLAAALSQSRGIEEQRARLAVTAPFAGTVVAVDDGFMSGRWYGVKMPLLELVDPSLAEIEAFVPESDLDRISIGAAGRFYAENLDMPAFDVRVIAIDPAATPILDRPDLASPFGGPIPCRRDDRGRLVPEEAVWRITLVPGTALPAPPQAIRGSVALESRRQSIVGRFWTLLAATMVRESGF